MHDGYIRKDPTAPFGTWEDFVKELKGRSILIYNLESGILVLDTGRIVDFSMRQYPDVSGQVKFFPEMEWSVGVIFGDILNVDGTIEVSGPESPAEIKLMIEFLDGRRFVLVRFPVSQTIPSLRPDAIVRMIRTVGSESLVADAIKMLVEEGFSVDQF